MAQVTFTDSVCAGTQDKVYGIMSPSATSTYNWYLDPAAGTIDNSIAPNDSIIEIDWGLNPGTYTMFAVETTADGCIGDSVELDVVIHPLPTALVVSDSVCENFSATLTFDLTGQAPWVIEYTDGTTNFTDTASATPYTVTTPPYTSSQTITVTNVTDGYTCVADPVNYLYTGAYLSQAGYRSYLSLLILIRFFQRKPRTLCPWFLQGDPVALMPQLTAAILAKASIKEQVYCGILC
ncbi:MAG: hypothetical protein U5L96_02360 [Owenweeksia sp.]|nr:hypothetical protein [Owenweeksia sp.]